jgi:AcrR family transcriptional regulator
LRPVSEAVTAERALRADAQRNLEAILEAAATAFAEDGLDACVADIAARADVGQATIFRRFETKDDLIAAVVERKLVKLREAAEQAAGRKHAWDGLREFMATAVEAHISDRGLFEAVHERLMADPRMIEMKAALLATVTALVERAKADGDLRRDVAPQDFPMLIAAAAQAGAIAKDADPEVWRRYLQIMLDGLRTDGCRGRLRAAPKIT